MECSPHHLESGLDPYRPTYANENEEQPGGFAGRIFKE